MGGNNSAFVEGQLEDYQELTYLTKKEIIRIFQRFQELDPERIMTPATAIVPRAKVLELKELRENPFKDRIVDVFTSSHDGNMTFDDFLDMMSVFSDAAPQAVKGEYAFRIYDFDGDEFIGEEDIHELITRLVGDQTFEAEGDIKELIGCVFEESDLDGDNRLSYAEFEHILSKAPDFMNTFRIRVQ